MQNIFGQICIAAALAYGLGGIAVAIAVQDVPATTPEGLQAKIAAVAAWPSTAMGAIVAGYEREDLRALQEAEGGE